MGLLSHKRLVTIVAEAVVEERLLRDLRAWGVAGFSVSRSEGDPFGARVADVEGAMVRIECIVSDNLAEEVMEALSKLYLPRYKVIAYDHDVRVVRDDKYP